MIATRSDPRIDTLFAAGSDLPPPADASGLANVRGRTAPRRRPDERREREILAATLELLATVGYERMSMDAVAATARVGKATLYRRWASKPDLVVDAMRQLFAEHVSLADTGDLRSDLLAAARGARDLLAGKMGDAVRGVLGELRHNADLHEAMRHAYAGAPRSDLGAVLARAAARGDIPATADVEMIAETGVSLLAARLLVSRQPVEDADLVRLVDHVLLPAAHAPPSG